MNERLESRLRALESAGLIRQASREPNPAYAFRHVLSLEAAYGSMLKLDRRQLHLDVGECLEQIVSDSLDENAPILSRHFDEAGDDSRALAYLTRAAESAARRYANREAIALLDRALVVGLRGAASGSVISDLCVRAGRLREMSGDYDAALRTYDQLEALAIERADAGMTTQAILARAGVFCAPTARYDAERGFEIAERALNLAREAGDRPAESKAQWLILLASRFSGQSERGIEAGSASVSIARELGLREQLAYTLNDLYLLHAFAGRLALSVDMLKEAEQLWRALGNLPLLADTLSNLGSTILLRDGPTAAGSALREAEQISDAIGNPWGQSYSKIMRSMDLLERARYDEAISLAEKSIVLGKEAGFAMSQIMAPPLIGLALAELGLHAQGAAICREALIGAEQTEPMMRGGVAAVIARCEIRSGDHGAAEKAIMLARTFQHVFSFPPHQLDLAEIEYARLEGQPALMLEKIAAAEAGFNISVGNLYLPVIWTQRAEAQLMLGRLDEAAATASETAELMREQGVRRGSWQLRELQARIALARGRISDSDEATARAQEEIEFVMQHANSEEARQAFLHLAEVQKLRGKS